ncbi:MAG: replication-associated recombination protein A [Peptococcaceae bacterium]|jgi:putative ATPase|nr:replication-associated recombination protein A [Peptococcaceae bacterium]MDH7525141.1 replication-associated recombination protein A [Peptococcaceae bacterium]
MDLFAQAQKDALKGRAPLAARMRPETLDELVGQEALIGPGKLLRRAIEADQLGSMIFYGPPGTGKTSLAFVIARMTKSHFVRLNAVTSGVNELRQVVRDAEERLGFYQQGTIVFIDEIHRFNRAQQDALLPSVEEGKIVLIGATTENPYFSVNSPLLSRSRLFRLEPLSTGDILALLRRALADKERGLGNYRTAVSPEALEHLAQAARGDARLALNGLELAVMSTQPDENGVRVIDLACAEESIQERVVLYDRTGDQHYDVFSAFIKSMRGSDPDAVLHYLARMLHAGEDPRAIARRLLIHAAEDVGLADPLALVVANAAAQGFEQVGLPEGQLLLAEAALYIACAPKSNSVLAVHDAMADVKNGKYGPVPMHLRDASYPGAGKMGHGKGYKYPHDYPEHYVEQDYLPRELKGVKYYKPSLMGKDRGVLYKKEAKGLKTQYISGDGDD